MSKTNRFRVLRSFAGPVATAAAGSEIELTAEQAEGLAGLVESIEPAKPGGSSGRAAKKKKEG